MLSIVATPIGNLNDITVRALETLNTSDAIVCEDTRVTGNLLKHLNIPKKDLVSMHSYSDPQKIDAVLRRLENGENIALVSDAGTPGISDPGYKLVSAARNRSLPVEVIPGPSAFLAALSASGLPINKFTYLGFLPLKKGRKTLLASFANEQNTIVCYESVHRVGKTLKEIAEALKEQPNRPVAIARELTKLYEETIRTTVRELPDVADTLAKKGEFVIVIGPQFLQ